MNKYKKRLKNYFKSDFFWVGVIGLNFAFFVYVMNLFDFKIQDNIVLLTLCFVYLILWFLSFFLLPFSCCITLILPFLLILCLIGVELEEDMAELFMPISIILIILNFITYIII